MPTALPLSIIFITYEQERRVRLLREKPDEQTTVCLPTATVVTKAIKGYQPLSD